MQMQCLAILKFSTHGITVLSLTYKSMSKASVALTKSSHVVIVPRARFICALRVVSP